jgi:patatin-like phospholipase/acyl hydrolase
MSEQQPARSSPEPERPFQILSLDGGGLKGLFAAAVLAELEADLQWSVIDHFDLIVGTSTGGLVALGIGAGLHPSDLVDFYVTEGPKVFGRGKGPVGNIRSAKHSPVALRTALEGVFGTRTLGDSVRPLVIPSYSLDAQDVYVFKTDHHPRLTRDWRESMVDVAMATTAAPTFLPAFALRNHRLIDGGVWANNPTLVGVVEAVSMFGISLPDIRVLSLGTTDELTHLDRSLDRAGLLRWACKGLPALLRAQSLGTFHAAEHLVGAANVVRINTVVPKGLFALDRVDSRGIRGLAEDVSRRAAPDVSTFIAHVAPAYTPNHRREDN